MILVILIPDSIGGFIGFVGGACTVTLAGDEARVTIGGIWYVFFTRITKVIGKRHMRFNFLLMILLMVDLIQLAVFSGNRISEVLNVLVVFFLFINAIAIVVKSICYYKKVAKEK